MANHPLSRMTLLSAALAASALAAGPAHADVRGAAQALTQQARQQHVETHRRAVTVDGEAATLIRHERRDGQNTGMGGEHFSVLLDGSGLLKGFAHMGATFAAGQPLPDRARTEQVARAFLQQAAPDLLPRMRISWIEPHDETIQVQRQGNTQSLKLTGMKMKARNQADGRWFWVIVGPDAQPMVFERDIVWINMPGHRQTEKWLHDDWLAQRMGADAR